MGKIFLTLFFFFTLAINSFCQWEEQKSGITIDLFDVCFTDSLNGFAVGESILLHTSDGGNNWTTQDFSSKRITDINAYNKNIAILTGDSEVVYITKNSGKNWLISNTGYPYQYYYSSYLNDSTIYITGTMNFMEEGYC